MRRSTAARLSSPFMAASQATRNSSNTARRRLSSTEASRLTRRSRSTGDSLSTRRNMGRRVGERSRRFVPLQ